MFYGFFFLGYGVFPVISAMFADYFAPLGLRVALGGAGRAAESEGGALSVPGMFELVEE